MQKQDFGKATEFFKEAYDLGPQFTESRVYYAMSAIYSGQLGLVDELIQTPGERAAFALNDLAVQAVYRAKMYPRLIEMFKIQIENKPTDSQARTNLVPTNDQGAGYTSAPRLCRAPLPLEKLLAGDVIHLAYAHLTEARGENCSSPRMALSGRKPFIWDGSRSRMPLIQNLTMIQILPISPHFRN